MFEAFYWSFILVDVAYGNIQFVILHLSKYSNSSKFQIDECWTKLGLNLVDHYQKNRQKFMDDLRSTACQLVITIRQKLVIISKKSETKLFVKLSLAKIVHFVQISNFRMLDEIEFNFA